MSEPVFALPANLQGISLEPDPDDDPTREWRAQGRDPKARKQR